MVRTAQRAARPRRPPWGRPCRGCRFRRILRRCAPRPASGSDRRRELAPADPLRSGGAHGARLDPLPRVRALLPAPLPGSPSLVDAPRRRPLRRSPRGTRPPRRPAPRLRVVPPPRRRERRTRLPRVRGPDANLLRRGHARRDPGSRGRGGEPPRRQPDGDPSLHGDPLRGDPAPAAAAPRHPATPTRLVDSLMGPRLSTAILFAGTLLLRRRPLAIGVLWAFSFALNAGRETALPEIPAGFFPAALIVVALLRFGFVGLGAHFVARQMLASVPLTLDLSAWYAGYGLFFVLVVLALAAWGFWSARGGGPLFGTAGLDD